MKAGLTELVFVLDRSGSMSGLVSDTIGGFNSLIEKQRKEPGEAFVTTVLFDDEYTLLHDHVDIKTVKELTDKEYYPRGTTALLDAIGKTINQIGHRLHLTPEDERPEQVMFVIITDGYENASTEFTKAQVKEMVEHQQEKYSWLFMFLGTNMDAIGEAASIGVDTRFARTYTNSSAGVKSVYSSVAMSMSINRSYNAKNSVIANAKNSVTADASYSTSNTVSREEMLGKMQKALDDVE